MNAPIRSRDDITPGPTDWVHRARDVATSGERCVVIIIREHHGSTPRESGTWMVVGAQWCFGTLGGGEVERVAIEDARDVLGGRKAWLRFDKKFQLGPDLGQCCGGILVALFEPVDQAAMAWLTEAMALDGQGYVMFPILDPHAPPDVFKGVAPGRAGDPAAFHVQSLIDERPVIVLYGAGHVGRAIAAVGAQMPARLEVVDERQEALADIPISENVKILHQQNPPSHAKTLSNVDAVLIMTHSHGLDYRLCQMVLGNLGLAYVGLIGSATKAMRFRRGLSEEGFSGSTLAGLTCPIGADGPVGKEPGIIAVAAWAEMMHVLRTTQIDRGRKIEHSRKLGRHG